MHKKKVGILATLAVILVYCLLSFVPVKAADYSIMYVKTSSCSTYLTLQGSVATCTTIITGKKGTTSISGTLKLYDVTAKKSVKSWTISKTGSMYSGSKTATIKSGHKYKLSFSGKVYNKNGSSETVSSSVTKKNS